MLNFNKCVSTGVVVAFVVTRNPLVASASLIIKECST